MTNSAASLTVSEYNQPSTTVALTANWTSLDATLTNSSNVGVFNNSGYGYFWSGYWYPYYQPIIVSHQDHRPIRLTMAEVERLRVAAKKDKELRATLEKFTDLIEVQVDFK